VRKFVLYSDQNHPKNNIVDAKLLSLIQKPSPRVGYIPSCADKTRKYFYENCKYYRKLGFEDFLYFDLDDEYEALKINELLSCDIVHLSAGDPIYFNHNIKRRNFVGVLQDFVDKGGILVGVSGGSLQLTKTVAIYKSFIGNLDDITHEDIMGLSALNLVDFEFLPHYNRWNQDFIKAVKAYSAKFSSLIYACKDGDGIVVNDNKIEFVGNIVKIENGIVMTPEESF